MNAKPNMVITIPVVIFGLFRYWYIVESNGGGESPTDALFEDKQLLVAIVSWAVICFFVV